MRVTIPEISRLKRAVRCGSSHFGALQAGYSRTTPGANGGYIDAGALGILDPGPGPAKPGII